MPRISLMPGMSTAQIKRLLANNKALIEERKHALKIIKILEEIWLMMVRLDIAVSGRLTITRLNGLRVVKWRGVSPIRKEFQKPTLLLDATLPQLSVLQVYHPQAEIVADIQAAMPPHVHIEQVLHAPTTSGKLKNSERRRAEVRRYILQVANGGEPTLVICQKDYDRSYLQANGGLPEHITVHHYNDVAGLDDYKNVRWLILVGRTAPGPQAMEAMAGALSGAQANPITPPGKWYNAKPVERGIRLVKGGGVETTGDQHRDPFVEAVRWQVCEGELIQALGRARGINRTADTPLGIHLLFDTCLPIAVDKVSIWTKPVVASDMIAEGVVLTSRIDIIKAWPKKYRSDAAARWALEDVRRSPELVALIARWQPVTYQLAGPKMKPRSARFDRARISDPKAWLERRIGPLKSFDLAGPAFDPL